MDYLWQFNIPILPAGLHLNMLLRWHLITQSNFGVFISSKSAHSRNSCIQCASSEKVMILRLG